MVKCKYSPSEVLLRVEEKWSRKKNSQPTTRQQCEFKVRSGPVPALLFHTNSPFDFIKISLKAKRGNIWLQSSLCVATTSSVRAEPKPEQSHGIASPFYSHWGQEARRRSGTRTASAVVRASDWVSPSALTRIFCATSVCSGKSRNSITSRPRGSTSAFSSLSPGSCRPPGRRLCGGQPRQP